MLVVSNSTAPTTPLEPSPSALEHGPDVVLFCKRNDLLDALQVAGVIAERHFPPPAVISVSLSSDSQAGERWVSLFARCPGSVQDVRNRFRSFRREFLAAMPSRALGRIQLSYAIE